MVYKRYIKKDGKIIGPYFYKSVRQNGKVRSVYVGQAAEKRSITLQPYIFIFAVIASIFLLFILFKPALTGYFVFNQEAFSKDISISTSESKTYDFDIDHEFFQLSSLSIDGGLEGDSAQVYLDFEGKEYLIGEFSGKSPGLVGYAISEFAEPEAPAPVETSQPEPIQELPIESNQSEQEQPAQTEPQNDTVAVINETANEIPTENEIPIEINESEIHPGNEFPIPAANDEQITNTNETENIPIMAKAAEFHDSCIETCSLNEIGIGKTKLKLRIDVHNAKLNINKISYSIVDLKNSLNIDDESLKELKEKGKVKVIIDLKKDELRGMNVQEAKSQLDVDVEKKFSNSNSVAGEITKEDLASLIYNGKISEIHLDSVNRILLAQSVPQINATSAWSKQVNGANITGLGETVCIVDTGVSNHVALQDKVIGKHCFCSVSGSCCPNGLTEDENATDDNSHGTHVAGIITSQDSVYKGIAPDAKIVAVKVCDSAGYCSSSDMIAGVEFCISNSSVYNISVISISIGGGGYSDYCETTIPAMTSAINSARAKGILVSVASGNNGYTDKITWPACIKNATAVMAVDKSDSIAVYSNRNAMIDLAAPGGSPSNKITSTVLNNGFDGKYGTSMACPHVSGATVLLQQYSRIYNSMPLSPEKIEDILRKNGKAINESGAEYYRIDVLSAINSIPKLNPAQNSIENPGKSKIQFPESTDLKDFDAFSIGHNFISLDASAYPQYSKPAAITFYNLIFGKMPVILKNGIFCSNCNVSDYNNGTLLFSIQGFSNYSSDVNAQLAISNDVNGTARINQNIVVYANYSSKPTNHVIAGECVISMNNSDYPMILNSTYSYNQSFPAWGQYNYNITCSSDDFETLSISDSINVTKILPIINMTLNGKPGNATALLNKDVLINASLIQPSSGNLKVYVNDSLISSGNSVSNSVSFNNYGAFSVRAMYEEDENYSMLSVERWINVINDTSSPTFNNLNGLNQVYAKNASYQISSTWLDNVEIGNVWIENNLFGSPANFSAERNNDEYYYRFGNLSAGIYNFRFYANDSSGNLNETGPMNLTIEKSSNPINLYLNNVGGNVSINYGVQGNVTAIGEGNVSLFRDGIKVNNPEISLLAVKAAGYAYKANATGNENYTDNLTGVSYHLSVGKSDPSLSLYLNGNQGDLNTQTKTIELEAVLTPSANVSISQNDVVITSGASPLTITRAFNSTGTYKIGASFAGNENYSSKTKTSYITITSSALTQQQQADLQQQLEAQQQAAAACTPSWQCSAWTSCNLGKKTRTCIDRENCGSNSNKPSETIDCGCQENWKCSEWSQCSGGMKTRDCTDQNKCSDNKQEKSLCLFPAMPFDLSKIADIGNSLESIGKTIDYLKSKALPVVKKPVFFVVTTAAILALLAIIFRTNVARAINGVKKYKFDVKFKIQRRK
jgi:subtilisin family serine protease